VFDSYSIDITFSFDSVHASADGYQRILDFKNRTSDSGLYSLGGSLVLFSAGGSGDPSASGSGQVFSDGVMADLLVQRSSAGVFSAYVNGQLAFSVADPNQATAFTGPNNIINFFMDDFMSLTNYPNLPEAGTGFIKSVSVSAVPLHSTWWMAILGSWHRLHGLSSESKASIEDGLRALKPMALVAARKMGRDVERTAKPRSCWNSPSSVRRFDQPYRTGNSRHHGEEQKRGKDDQVDNALQYRGPASAERDDAQKQCEHQQCQVLGVQPEFEPVP
jgi:hypothetical protein